VTFLGADELRPNTPLFINGVSTTLDFNGKLMSIPFYTKEGVLTLLSLPRTMNLRFWPQKCGKLPAI
jgi:hypothetical protein